MATKRDNGNLRAKLELRRYFLLKYHAGTNPIVCDACAGKGVIWRTLRKDFDIQYQGFDKKGGPGLIKMDSVRALNSGPLPYDIVDIDTYGFPWNHYIAVLQNKKSAVTVFLTIGQTNMPGKDATGCRLIGMAGLSGNARILQSHALAKYVRYCLTVSYDYAMIPIEIKEAENRTSKTRYFGIRLEPKGVTS